MTRRSDYSDPIDVDSMHGESCTPNERDNVAAKNNHEHGNCQTIDVDVESGHKRKLTSSVWDHFQRKMMNGKMRALCSGCTKDFVGDSKSGTTHLRDHLKICFKVKNQVDVRQSILRATVKTDSSSISMGKYKFNPDVTRHELWNMIVLHGYPLCIVDQIGFRRYSNSLNPDFKVISRNTLKSDIMRAYKEEKEKLKKLISSHEGRVAITSDMWTSTPQKKGYMAVTAHFIDDDSTLQSRLIR